MLDTIYIVSTIGLWTYVFYLIYKEMKQRKIDIENERIEMKKKALQKKIISIQDTGYKLVNGHWMKAERK